jgi:hypothetical protein
LLRNDLICIDIRAIKRRNNARVAAKSVHNYLNFQSLTSVK